VGLQGQDAAAAFDFSSLDHSLACDVAVIADTRRKCDLHYLHMN
jgi:hypothetical protein